MTKFFDDDEIISMTFDEADPVNPPQQQQPAQGQTNAQPVGQVPKVAPPQAKQPTTQDVSVLMQNLKKIIEPFMQQFNIKW